MLAIEDDKTLLPDEAALPQGVATPTKTAI
jgi:hypothetical protein